MEKPNLCSLYLESQVSSREKADPFKSLTPRENEVMELFVRGLQNKDIAQQLSLSENTVRNHIASIFMKLKVNNRTAVSFLWHNRGKAAEPKKDPFAWDHPLEKKHGKV